MINHVFTSMSSKKMVSLINKADQVVSIATPAMSTDVADALVIASQKLGNAAISVVMDCDEEVFRLGYGDFSSIKPLYDAGIDVRQCSGLRIGVLICDEYVWVFSPTALYVQPEVHSDETPNAICLTGDVAMTIMNRICQVKASQMPEISNEGDFDRPIETTQGVKSDSQLIDETSQMPVVTNEGDLGSPIEIGQSEISDSQLIEVEKNLKLAPPIAFDIARQVRVFEPYIQYVEISLKGCSIQRKRVQIPKSIQNLGETDIEDRLRTTFDLIEKSSDVSSKDLEDKLGKIRNDWTRSLGKPWGRVILKNARPKFDQRMDDFRESLKKHLKSVEENIEKHIEESKEQVVKHYLPLFKERPPDEILGQLLTSEPTEDDVRRWLRWQVDKGFPSTADLIGGMHLDIQFRDVTYETLKEDGFCESLKKAYPDINWDKPFDEFDAAKEKA